MVADKLEAVRTRIAAAAERVGREPASITLVAVTKARTVPEILTAYEAGHRDFGENRAQELVDKAPMLPDDIRWHFIGHLQRNKVNAVRPVVALLHSVDSARLARSWVSRPASPVLLQVNIGDEPQKNGVPAGDAAAILDEVRRCGADVHGLMAIPPLGVEPENARPYFRALNELARTLRTGPDSLQHLSMGMTDDYEVAVEEGATIVRVGRAIFGPRPGG